MQKLFKGVRSANLPRKEHVVVGCCEVGSGNIFGKLEKVKGVNSFLRIHFTTHLNNILYIFSINQLSSCIVNVINNYYLVIKKYNNFVSVWLTSPL